MNYPVVSNQLDHFLNQVRSIKPLTAEQEYELAVRYKESGEIEAAHELVVFTAFCSESCVSIPSLQIPVQDLIQENYRPYESREEI